MGNRDRDDTGRYADGIDPEVVLEVFEARDDHARPITATDVVEELGIARRTAHNKLEVLAERGEIETRKVGARGRVWWTPIHDPDTLDAADLQGNPENTIDELDASDSDATVGRDDAVTQPSGQHDESDTQPTEATDDAVTTALDAVEYPSGNDPDDVAHAYTAVREYLIQHGPARKGEITEAIRPDHPLSYDPDAGDGGDGRDRGSWWRKVIQPLLDADPEVGFRDNYNDYDINQ